MKTKIYTVEMETQPGVWEINESGTIAVTKWINESKLESLGLYLTYLASGFRLVISE